MISLKLCLTPVLLSLLRWKFIDEWTEKVDISINLSFDIMEKQYKIKLINSTVLIWVKIL